MYSLCNISIKRDFIQQELSREYLSFPNEIDEAYTTVINWLYTLPGMANFDESRNFKLDSYEMLDTGRQFSQLLPRHAMKAYQTLLGIEYESITKNESGILDQPYILLVDVGCGGGTASVAIISLIVNFQKYRINSGLPMFPVIINCFGIDINDNALEIYGVFLKECAAKTEKLMVDIKNVKILPGTLPANTASIIEWIVDEGQTYRMIIACANIIRPLTKEYEEANKSRNFFDGIGIGGLLQDRYGKDIGAGEIATLNAFLKIGKIDQIIALLVGAYSTNAGERKSWRDEMLAFQKAVKSKLEKSHKVKISSIVSNRVKMINPPANYWRKYQGHEKSNEIEYDSGFIIINLKDYLGDNDWHDILKLDNLLLAWARVRNSLSYEMLEDTVEVRLFEANIEERLQKLRHDILSYQWDLLNVGEMLNFRVPKGIDKAPRPMSLCRLEDQILATAILQVKAKEYSISHHPRSYAYRLLPKPKGEQVYKDWFDLYQKEYLADARKIAQQNPSYLVIRTDISSYYEDIVQSKLFSKIENQLGLYHSRSNFSVEKLINRDCGVEKSGCGIPQGHIISGVMSNLYLTGVDNLFGLGNKWGIEYFRFVDDMIFIFPPNIKAEFILDQLDQALLDLGLTRSQDKTTKPMTTQEFLEQTTPDSLLEDLSREHNFLLSELYKLGRDYIRICLEDWWTFVECYQKLLVSIGVYISAPRLSRKLQKNLRWWRRTLNWWYKLEMPNVQTPEDLKDIEKWKVEFELYQSQSPGGWVNRRKQLVGQLLDLFRNSLMDLDSDSEIKRSRAKTRIKFALHRLGQLGFGKEVHTVVDLITEQPWILHPRRVCRDLALQGHEGLLCDAFTRISNREGKEWGYIRGVILKALSILPSVNECTIAILKEAAFNGKTILERTMASETLFLLQKTQCLEKDNVINAVTQSTDNYLGKNYAILQAKTPGDGNLTANLTYGSILNEALEYVRVVPTLDQLYRHEPDILREKFYEGDYPDDPTEFEDFPY